MQKRIRKCNLKFIFVILIFGCTEALAQSPEKIALRSLFEVLEVKHNVRFSYASDIISDIRIVAPKSIESLVETLAYLEQNTAFHYNQIDDRYITVALKSGPKSLCGKIVDTRSNLPLEGANIVDNSSVFATVANRDGIFFLADLTAGSTVSISYVGYETKVVDISQLSSDCSPIRMQPIIVELNRVDLQTYFTKGISKQTNGSFTINTDNFGLLPGQVDGDVLQIAQALPGVESADETISNINIRGGTHDETSILWDDIKMYQSGHFFGLISAFNPDLTKSVTVQKNGTHPRFGEGVSGLIDMRSENTISSSFSGGVGFNLINTQAFAEIPLSKSMGVQVSGRRSINDFLQSPVYDIYTDRIFQDSEITNLENNSEGANVSSENSFKFYDFSTKLLWDISESGDIRLNFLTVDNSLEFTETLDTSAMSETSQLQQRSLVGGLSWRQLWNKNLNTSFLAYGSYYLLNSVNEEIFTNQELIQENEVLETGVKLDVNAQLSERIDIEAGYHFSETGIANTQDVNLPRFRSFERKVLQSHIGFGNLRFTTLNKKTLLNLGFRANYYSKLNEFLLEPRLSIHHAFGNGFSITGLGEFKSQTTTQRIDFESDFLGVEKRRWVLSDNEAVPIVRSKQASLGFAYTKNNWLVSLEGFFKYVDGITTSNQGFQNQFQFIRTNGSYSSRGAEFVLNKKTKSFSTWLSYLWLKSDYNFDTLIPPDFPSNLDIRHTATLASSFTMDKWKFAFGINWHSGRPYTVPKTGEEILITDGIQSIQYDYPNGERLSSYFRANLSTEYLWELSDNIDAKFNFAVVNILNTKNTLNIRYALDTDENGEGRINQIDEVSLGLTPNFSFQLLF